jgi:hypothetical protein
MEAAKPSKTNSNQETPSQTQPDDLLNAAKRLARLMFWARSLCSRTITDDEADIHMHEWGLVADQVGIDALEQAVTAVVRNDTAFFPAIDKIRKRSGMNQDEQNQIEGGEAWAFIKQYVRRHWTPDLGACSFNGRPAPSIPPGMKNSAAVTEWARPSSGILLWLRANGI